MEGITKPKKKIAIVTGASAGLGKEFALQLEKDYFLDEIWLVARRLEPMKEIAEEFRKAKGVLLQLDLTNQGDMAKLGEKLKQEAPNVHIVVNNAGIGKIGPFAALSRSEQLATVDLNVRALTELTYLAIPYMEPGSYLVQVASSIGFAPSPYFAVYAATKAYVVSLSYALFMELREKGIHVIAVCPGPVETEFFTMANQNEYYRKHGADGANLPRNPVNKYFMVSPKKVVEKALKDMRKKKIISVYGFIINIFVKLVPFVPQSIALRLLDRRKAQLEIKG